jgi:hypothetical protein
VVVVVELMVRVALYSHSAYLEPVVRVKQSLFVAHLSTSLPVVVEPHSQVRVQEQVALVEVDLNL